MKKLALRFILPINFAKKIAPFKIVPLANIEDKNFHFYRPKIHSIENYLLSQNLLISDDLCLSTIELSSLNYLFADFKPIIHSLDILPSVENKDFDFILQPIEIQDVIDLIAGLTSLPEIENIDFQFKKSRIEGKNYEKVEANTKLLNMRILG